VQDLTTQFIATLLVTLRIVPMLAFSQPFTLVRIPATIRVLLAIGIAAWLVARHPAQTWQAPGFAQAGLPLLVAKELFAGIALALGLQLAFAAILMVGRAIDIQAGFGLAALVDPTTRAQLPLVGTLLALLGGLVFFAMDGAIDLLALFSLSLERLPIGAEAGAGGMALTALMGYLATVFVLALGLVGTVLLTLLLIDITIAVMSRTLPQMNVLLLGFQVKVLATMLVLPIALSFSVATFLRMLRLAIETAPRLLMG